MLSRIAVGVIRVTPKMEQPKAIFGCDVHFLMIAVKHLDRVLKLLDTGAPRLDKGLKPKAIDLDVSSHWQESDEGKGYWTAI